MPVFHVIEYWLGSFVFFSRDPCQYCQETLYFSDFFSLRGGGVDPLHPLDPPMHYLVFVVWPMLFSLIIADV